MDCTFTPHVSIGHVGGKIAAKNSDPVLHNTNLKLKEKGRVIALATSRDLRAASPADADGP